MKLDREGENIHNKKTSKSAIQLVAAAAAGAGDEHGFLYGEHVPRRQGGGHGSGGMPAAPSAHCSGDG